MRTFLYARVSTADQVTGNQLLEVAAAGFAVEPHRVVEEIVSGSTLAMQRPGFVKLLERLESGDRLIVSKMDRLGRNSLDVQGTVRLLEGRGVHVHCLALGGADLTSSSGKMVMGVLSAVAEFELDQIKERTNAGLARAKAQGKRLGRPVAVNTRKRVLREKSAGMTQSRAAAVLRVSIRTVKRYWNEDAA